ncbi:MAG TPA: hypothetical protein VH592_03780 [Gemmataceae bacterium]|jgi:hypothetical protein
MRVEFYGLVLETPRVSVYLWSPWRAAALEHRLFDAIRVLPRVSLEKGPDEVRVHIDDSKTFRSAMQAAERVLKGWQEEADPGSERRSWRWLLEGDTDADGYDHTGEPISLWGFLRLGLERGVPGEGEKNEDIDLEGFGVQMWGER